MCARLPRQAGWPDISLPGGPANHVASSGSCSCSIGQHQQQQHCGVTRPLAGVCRHDPTSYDAHRHWCLLLLVMELFCSSSTSDMGYLIYCCKPLALHLDALQTLVVATCSSADVLLVSFWSVHGHGSPTYRTFFSH